MVSNDDNDNDDGDGDDDDDVDDGKLVYIGQLSHDRRQITLPRFFFDSTKSYSCNQ